MAADNRGIVLGPGEGDVIPVRDTQFVYKASGQATGGAFELFEYTEPPGGRGPDPHVHRTHDEAFYILDGEMEFTMAGERIEAPAGSFVLVPKGVPHSFGNPGSVPARFLGIVSPPGLRDMFRERAEEAARIGGELSAEARIEIGKRHDQHPV